MFYQLPFLHGNFVTSDVTVYTKSTNAHRVWTRRSTARTGSKFENQSGTTFINLQLRVSDIHVPVTLRCSKISEIFDSLDTAVVKRKINCWEGNTLTSHSWQQEKQFPIVNCSNHCNTTVFKTKLWSRFSSDNTEDVIETDGFGDTMQI